MYAEEQARWSIVDEHERPAEVSEPAWNMGLDTFNLDCVVMNASKPRLRLYEWTAPAITLGRFQHPERSIQREICRSLNLPVARRPTGGRGILHGSDLTVSLAASLGDLCLSDSTSITDIYGSISTTMLAAFAAIGLRAERGRGAAIDIAYTADCMASVTRADIVSADSGAKILGAALVRKSNCVLFQCTIPANTNTVRWQELQSSVFSGPRRPSEPAQSACDLGELKIAIVRLMEARFLAAHANVRLNPEAVRQVIGRANECRLEV